MLYHQQFKGLTHVIISCFTSVEIIMVPNSLIHTLQIKTNFCQQINDVGDGFCRRRNRFRWCNSHVVMTQISCWNFWISAGFHDDCFILLKEKAPLMRLDPLESAKNNPKISKFGLSGQNLRENTRIEKWKIFKTTWFCRISSL